MCTIANRHRNTSTHATAEQIETHTTSKSVCSAVVCVCVFQSETDIQKQTLNTAEQTDRSTLLQADMQKHTSLQVDMYQTADRQKCTLLQTEGPTTAETETHITAVRQTETYATADRQKHILLYKHTHTVQYALLHTEGTETRTTPDKTKINPKHSTRFTQE